MVATQTCPVNTLTVARPTTLLSLPKELLTLIVTELSLSDILKARLACRTLNDVCGTGQVWKHVFLRSLGVSIPDPFFLKKPLEENSPKEIQHAICRWGASWLPSTSPQQFKRYISSSLFNGRCLRADTLTLCPGGRWSLGACDDGSIWYFDLSDDWTSTAPIEPKLLLPGFPPESGIVGSEGVNIRLAFDWTSATALGDSEKSHCLHQFNFAVCIWPLKGRHMLEPMHVNVWQVRIQEGSMCLGEHLSSFREDPSFGMSCLSLYGGFLAYHLRIILVVDWREANGRTKDETLSCKGLFMNVLSVESLNLLPGNRLLVIFGNRQAALYNWEFDFPLSDFVASEVLFRGGLPKPVWKHRWRWGSTIDRCDQQPFVVDGAIRMVIPTNHAVHGLTIKLDDYTPTGVQLRTLLEDESHHFGSYNRTFQLNRAVGMRRDEAKELFYAQYWAGGEVEEAHFTTGLCAVPNPLHVSHDTQPADFFLDLFTNRVVAVPLDEPVFCTIFASRVPDEEEGKGEDASTMHEGTAEGDNKASCSGAQESNLNRMPPSTPGGEDSPYGFESDGDEDDSGKEYSSGESSWKGVGPGYLGEQGVDESEPDEILNSDGGHSDGEAGWKGVVSGEEHSNSDSDRTVEPERHDNTEGAGENEPALQEGGHSDDDTSWKGVGSEAGDWDSDRGKKAMLPLSVDQKVPKVAGAPKGADPRPISRVAHQDATVTQPQRRRKRRR